VRSETPGFGETSPRLLTPPLVAGPPGPCGCGCALTEDTSDGFDLVRFAKNVMGTPLDPWERRAAIHGLELLPDGRPRFRVLLIIVARQNGKTTLGRVLIAYWMFVLKVSVVLGIANKFGYAKVQWEKVLASAEANKWLAPRIAKVIKALTMECITTESGSEYRIAAANGDAGRSLSIERLFVDELRTHKDFACWSAAYKAMNAMPYGQAVVLTNQGSDSSVVLDSLRNSAIEFIETGVGDPRLGLIEYSAPEGSDPTDPAALTMANPNVGHRIDIEDLIGEGTRAKLAGGEELTQFLTEVMCIRVREMNPAFDPAGWENGKIPGTLDGLRDRVALVWDVSPDLAHATLTAAATGPDGRTRVEPVAAWTAGAAEHGMNVMIKELKEHVVRIRPKAFGWLPGGPAAAYSPELTAKDAAGKSIRPKWLPRGTKMAEIKSDVAAVCMGFAEQVKGSQVLHSGDPLQDAHVLGAQKLPRGDRWVIARLGGGHCDGAYAGAGAVHLARTIPASSGKPRLIVVDDEE